jgi:hypothetical protein
MLVLALLLQIVTSQTTCEGASSLPLMATDEQVLSILTKVQPNAEMLKACLQVFFERGYYTPVLKILNDGDNL